MLKIAFLFLTITNVYHEEYWKDFFTGHEDCYTAYIHSKEPLANSSLLKRHEVPMKIRTSWANTMRAQMALLKEALNDPMNEKFIFVSDSTIPLTDFDTAYKMLLTGPESMFYFRPNPHVNHNGDFSVYNEPTRNLKPLPTGKQFKNTQWIVLNRKHAQMMVEDSYYIDIISRYPCDNEHYPATFLINMGQFDEITPCDVTYVEWHKGPEFPYVFKDFTKVGELELIEKAMQQGYLFARKIDKDCKLAPLDALLPYRKQKKAPAQQAVQKSETGIQFMDMNSAKQLVK